MEILFLIFFQNALKQNELAAKQKEMDLKREAAKQKRADELARKKEDQNNATNTAFDAVLENLTSGGFFKKRREQRSNVIEN